MINAVSPSVENGAVCSKDSSLKMESVKDSEASG